MTRAARAIPIVATKLAPPRTVVPSVLPGTLTKIEKGAWGRLLVVQAPAGYGKTTVLAYAARSLRWRTAWYKLDALDQDPMVFAASLVQSIRKRVPGFGTILEERLADIAEVPLSTSEALGILASELASEVDGELHIVLDDYHEAANSAGLNSAIDYLLGSMPDHLHVIVLTRYEPSFQLAKLRLSDDAAELREDDLRLGAEQVTAIVGERAGLSLVHDDVEALLRFTEGWAASVILTSKSLSSHELHALRDALEDPRLRVDVYSYLAEQVLAKESDRVQQFLKSTCCLEYMTPALADDVTDSSHTERFLAYLTAKGLFTLRTEEGNFRYHRLFRDYLRHRVAQDDGPAAFREQQLKAAAALSRTGDFQAAAELYFCAGHPALAAGAIARSGETGIDSCAADTLAGWAERLNLAEAPVAAYREYLEGHVLLRRGDYASALSSFRRAHHLLGEGQERRVRFLVLSAIERALFWQGDYVAAADTCAAAARVAETVEERVHALASMGAALSSVGDWRRAERVHAAAETEAAGQCPGESIRIRSQRAIGRNFRGQFREAKADAEDGADAVWALMPVSYQVGYLNMLAILHLQAAEYTEAARFVDRGLELTERFGHPYFEPHFHDLLGQLACVKGRAAQGVILLRNAAAHPAVAQDNSSRSLILSHLGTSQRRTGEYRAAATTYREAVRVAHSTQGHYARLTCLLNLAYAQGLANGQPIAGGVARLGFSAGQRGYAFIEHKAAVFQALLMSEASPRWAMERLADAVPVMLNLGQLHFLSSELMTRRDVALSLVAELGPNAVVLALVDALARHHDSLPLMLKALTLSEETALGVLKASAQHLNDENWRVLAGRARRHRSPAVRRAAADLSASRLPMDKGLTPDLPELTAREREVLRLIADGLRNADISQRLYLSPGTVKTYVNRIFSKLGVQDRVHAVLYYKDQVGR